MRVRGAYILVILILVILIVVLLFALILPGQLHHGQPTAGQTATSQPTTGGQATATANSSGLSIRVSGNQLLNGQGQPVRLIGVDVVANAPCRMLPPSATQAASAIASWHANAVRITMNEDCWLGINNISSDAGNSYKNLIINFVNLLHSHGIYTILDLQNADPGTTASRTNNILPDADHAPSYWQSVASAFKNDHAAIFDLINEPHITTLNAQTSNPWQCWRDGCMINGNPPWQAVGMQTLINDIRSTGATNPIMLGGLNYSEDLTQFLQYLPSDPQHQLIASYHNYMGARNTLAYWNRVIAPIAEQIPLITDEFGEKDCGTSFVSEYMNWADQHNISYLAWEWWTQTNCRALGLISDWSGTPSAYGQTMYNHYRTVNPTS